VKDGDQLANCSGNVRHILATEIRLRDRRLLARLRDHGQASATKTNCGTKKSPAANATERKNAIESRNHSLNFKQS
jgi:hypothetical protein